MTTTTRTKNPKCPKLAHGARPNIGAWYPVSGNVTIEGRHFEPHLIYLQLLQPGGEVERVLE
jgi:hypothetical protein